MDRRIPLQFPPNPPLIATPRSAAARARAGEATPPAELVRVTPIPARAGFSARAAVRGMKATLSARVVIPRRIGEPFMRFLSLYSARLASAGRAIFRVS